MVITRRAGKRKLDAHAHTAWPMPFIIDYFLIGEDNSGRTVASTRRTLKQTCALCREHAVLECLSIDTLLSSSTVTINCAPFSSHYVENCTLRSICHTLAPYYVAPTSRRHAAPRHATRDSYRTGWARRAGCYKLLERLAIKVCATARSKPVWRWGSNGVRLAGVE